MKRRVLWIGVSVLGALGALAALLTIPGLEERPLVVRTDQVIQVRRGHGPDALRFAVAHVFSTRRGQAGLAPLARLLSQSLGRPVRMIERGRYQEVLDLLRTGAADVAFVGAGAYLRARHEGLPLEVVAVALRPSGGPSDRSATIVAADSAIRSFAALEGRPFAFADPLSLTGHYHALQTAVAEGRDPRVFFRHAIFTYEHRRSIAAVLDGSVDGASVDTGLLSAEKKRRPGLASQLRVVHQSPPLAPSPIVARSSLSTRVRQRLRSALLDLARSPVGQTPLREQGVERFVAPSAGAFDDAQRDFDALMARLEGS